MKIAFILNGCHCGTVPGPAVGDMSFGMFLDKIESCGPGPATVASE
jgi:hypothetical protein